MLSAQDLDSQPERLDPRWRHDHDGQQRGRLPRSRRLVRQANVCDTGALDANGRPVGNPDAFGNNRDFLGNATRNFDYAPSPLARQSGRRRHADRDRPRCRTRSGAAP